MSGGRTVALGDREYLIGELPIAERDWILSQISPLFSAAFETVHPPALNAQEPEALDWGADILCAVFEALPEDDFRRILQSCADVCRVRCGGEWVPLPAQENSSPADFSAQLHCALQVIDRSAGSVTSQLGTFFARRNHGGGHA